MKSKYELKFQPVYGSLFVSAENRYIISDSNHKPSYEYIKNDNTTDVDGSIVTVAWTCYG